MALDSSRRRDFLILAAERQERERQIGADCSLGYFESTDAEQLFDGPQTLECFFRHKRGSKLQQPAGFSIDSMELRIPGYMDILVLYCGGSYIEASLVDGHDYHVVLTYDGIAAIAYLNGTLIGSFTPTNYVVPPSFRIGNSLYPPKGPVYFCRQYNYALSAEEVSELYNNGDPAGYVLPGGMKYRELSYESDFSKGVNGWEGNSAKTTVSHIDGGLSVTGTSTEYQMNRNSQVTPSIAARYNVHIEFVEPTPTDATILFVAYSGGTEASKLISTGTTSVDLITPINSTLYRFSYLYFRGVTPGTVFKIKSISVKFAGCIAEYLPQNLVTSGLSRHGPVEILGNNSYTWTGPDDIFSKTITTSQLPVFGQWYRIEGVVSNYEAGTPNVSADSGFTEYALPRANGKFSVLAKCKSTDTRPPYSFMFRGGPRGTNRLVTIEVNNIEPVGNIASQWLDSAKQLPLNDEYLPPLLEPIVIGDATPVKITGNNSYTWTGVDDPVYSRNITTSRRPTLGQWYRIVGSISGYEKGYPYISADTGYTEVALPRTDGPFSVLVQCKSAAPSSYFFSYRAGNRGTDRTLTITVDSIEPVVERGYDMAVNGTPEIDYKPTMIVDWSMLVPMSLDGLVVYPGGTVPPAIVDGVLRITSNEKQENYGGGGYYPNVVNATPGDTVKWDFEIRASGITEAMACLCVAGRLYYIKIISTTPEWQRYSYVTPITTNPATDFWISKTYNDTTAGYIEIRNITIKTYRK